MNNPALIAIVDDDQPLRGALVNLVRSLGFVTLDFGSAASFLSSSARREVDVLLSDVRIPEMDGLVLRRMLRASGAALPIIMMSAEVDPEVLDEAEASGAVAILRKPFGSDLLANALERAMEVASC